MYEKQHAMPITRTKGKRFIKTETDRISELPDDILSSIISYFTVRDAANSGLLSTRWRHLCASLFRLDFHLDSMFRTHRDCNIERSRSMDICRQYKDIFVRGVNQFLQSYKGTRLVFFAITFCLEQDSTYDVDHWVKFAIRMGVEHLILNLSCSDCFVFDSRTQGRDLLYTLRSELLLQGNVAKIQRLSLCACILGPGVITQFSGLKFLELSLVSLGQHEVESIGSCCLSLECLSLIGCTLPPKFCISVSFKRLNFLGVTTCWGVEMIELSSTNLTNFEYDGSLITFSFSEVPNLKKLYFRVPDGKGAQYAFSQLAKDLPLVETLLVFSASDWGKFLQEDITIFKNVKELELFSPRQSESDTLKIIAILKACPLLEKFHLVLGIVYYEEGIISPLSTPPESVHKHLKEVYIGGFRSKLCFIKAALYMLEYVAALERMVIDPEMKFYDGLNCWAYFQRKTWDEGEREKVIYKKYEPTLESSMAAGLLVIS